MNIAFVTPSWPKFSDPNGIVTYYDNLIPSLISLGHTVHIITFHLYLNISGVYILNYKFSFSEKLWYRFKNYIDPGYKQYYVGSRSIVDKLTEIHEKFSIDIVEMEDSFGWHYFVQKNMMIPVVIKLHGPYFLNNFEYKMTVETNRRIKRETRAFLSARFVSAPSKNVLDLSRRRYGDNWLAFEILMNPIRKVDKSKRWKFLSMIRYQILFVGRFDNHKGGDLMLHAFFKIKSILPQARLVFIGPDKGLEIANRRLNIKDFLQKNSYQINDGKQQIVRFMGKKDQEIINFYRRTSHVTVVCSRYETFGNVALEAIACGSPLVCSDAGGLPEIIENGISGLLFESENIEDLSKKIFKVLTSNRLAIKLSDGAILRSESTYAPNNIANHMIKFYDRVIALAQQ